ncbi:unnamed protein product [Amaranthus hypochondriacus]
MVPKRSGVNEVDGASPGKIFVGGLAKDTNLDTFTKYFEKYGEVVDSVIMKDRLTGRPRGFGFITYADPSVVDTVIKEDHIINDKQVEIKRTIPKGVAQTNDFKTKKIFVGGIPTTVTEGEFKEFFSKYGKVVEHEIILDHATKRSRGFGFIVFDNEKVVDDILADGNMIEMNDSRVSLVLWLIGVRIVYIRSLPVRSTKQWYNIPFSLSYKLTLSLVICSFLNLRIFMLTILAEPWIYTFEFLEVITGLLFFEARLTTIKDHRFT